MSLNRYRSPETGFPSADGDFSAHIAISQDIAKGRLFPNIRSASASVHTLSGLLPVYHGIIGAHLEALAFMSLFRLSLTHAMLLATDLSFALFIICVLFLARRGGFRVGVIPALICVILFALPMFSKMLFSGFYSQIVSIGFYSMAILLLEEKSWSAAVFLSFAALCYPDGVIWILPVCIMITLDLHDPLQLLRHPIGFICAIIVPIFLFLVQVHRLFVPGPLDVYWYMLLLILPFQISKKTSEADYIANIYLVATSTLALISLLLVGSIKYYAAKNFLWAPFILCLACPAAIRQKSAYLYFVVSAMALFLWTDFYRNSAAEISAFASAKSSFPSQSEMDLLSLLGDGSCSEAAAVPSLSEEPHRGALVAIANAFSGRVEPYSLNFKVDNDTSIAMANVVNPLAAVHQSRDRLKSSFDELHADCVVFSCPSSATLARLKKSYSPLLDLKSNKSWIRAKLRQ